MVLNPFIVGSKVAHLTSPLPDGPTVRWSISFDVGVIMRSKLASLLSCAAVSCSPDLDR